MKVLLINGSPNENGCTFTALSVVANALNSEGIDTEIFHIGNKAIHGCTGCGSCSKTGKCVFDDTVNIAAEKMKEADGLVIGSPVYFASANGSLISFLDRMFMVCKDFAYKPGAAIASARRAGTTATIDELQKYLIIRNMPLAASNYWPMVHGSKPEDVLKDEEGVQIMRILGKNMAWLLKSIEAGKNVGIKIPEQEENIKTNFIK